MTKPSFFSGLLSGFPALSQFLAELRSLWEIYLIKRRLQYVFDKGNPAEIRDACALALQKLKTVKALPEAKEALFQYCQLASISVDKIIYYRQRGVSFPL